MLSNEQKQLARELRERRFRRRLATLSWTVPVIAFGSFFSIWHNVSAAVNPAATSKQSNSVASSSITAKETASTHGTTATASALFKIGSKSQQVSVIQEQLQELGYFSHAVTEYYGPVTAQAVEAFQSAQHLAKTGEIDGATFNALQQAIKNHHTSSLVSESTDSRATTVHSNPPVHHIRHSVAYRSSQSASTIPKSSQTTSQSSVSTTSSAAVSQQSSSQTSSSAS